MEKWATDTLGAIPPIPVPFLLALIFYLLLITPLIRRAIKSDPEPEADEEPSHSVTMDAGGIYTILVNLQIEVAKLRSETSYLTSKVHVIDKMLRRRSGRSKKLTPPTEDEPEPL